MFNLIDYEFTDLEICVFFLKFKHQQWGFHDGDDGNPVVRPGEQKRSFSNGESSRKKGVLRVLLDRWNL